MVGISGVPGVEKAKTGKDEECRIGTRFRERHGPFFRKGIHCQTRRGECRRGKNMQRDTKHTKKTY